MTDIILKHFGFFLVGVVQDILATYYYQMIAKGRPWRAASFSSVVTLVNLVILYEILTGIENQVLSIIIVYALGNGVGTFIVVKKEHVKKLLVRVQEKFF